MSDEMVCTIDIAASLAAIVGQDIPADACTDSMDVSQAFLGIDGAKGREHLVQQDNGSSGTYGLRVGKWKLHRADRKSARNVVVETQLANTKVPRYQLFDLEADPAEKHNIAEKHPETTKMMIAKLDEIIESGRTRN